MAKEDFASHALRTFALLSYLVCSPALAAQSANCRETSERLYDFSRKTLPDFGGKTIKFDAYKGNVVIAVNVASF